MTLNITLNIITIILRLFLFILLVAIISTYNFDDLFKWYFIIIFFACPIILLLSWIWNWSKRFSGSFLAYSIAITLLVLCEMCDKYQFNQMIKNCNLIEKVDNVWRSNIAENILEEVNDTWSSKTTETYMVKVNYGNETVVCKLLTVF